MEAATVAANRFADQLAANARYPAVAGNLIEAGRGRVGLLDGDIQKGLDWGTAASASKHSIPGDFAWITREEVEGLLKGGGMRISR